MNNEARLLSKAIQDRNVSYLLEKGVSEAWFHDVEDKRVFKFLQKHYANYSETPSAEAINEIIDKNFPNYKLIPVDDSIDYLLDSIVDERRKAIVIHTLDSAISAIEKDKDHDKALNLLSSAVLRVEEEGLSNTNFIDISKAASLAKQAYEYRKANPGMLGYSTGFPTMDEATAGMQPGQLIFVVAPPKTGKSTLALQMAATAHLNNLKPMFLSFEMTNAEQELRYYAIRARISHHRLRTGSLTPDEEARFYLKLDSIQAQETTVQLGDSGGGQTVSAIGSQIQNYKPDILFIDGVYLLQDEQGAEAYNQQMTNITRALKRLAMKAKIPIVATTQVLNWKMRKGQVTADAIGYSSSFHQDADVIFGLQREDETVDDTRTLKVIANRNGGFHEVPLMWDWDTGLFREIDESDL
jgi:replicative DNA helicase